MLRLLPDALQAQRNDYRTTPSTQCLEVQPPRRSDWNLFRNSPPGKVLGSPDHSSAAMAALARREFLEWIDPGRGKSIIYWSRCQDISVLLHVPQSEEAS